MAYSRVVSRQQGVAMTYELTMACGHMQKVSIEPNRLMNYTANKIIKEVCDDCARKDRK